MKLLKKLVAVSAVAACMAGSAYASPINVGGVTWDPNAANDFAGASVAISQSINPTDGSLSGFGVVNAIDGNFGFCAGCVLTFAYSGYTPTGSTLVPSPGLQFDSLSYVGGVIDFYVESASAAASLGLSSGSAASLTAANTTFGALWLATAGHTYNGASLIGNSYSNGSTFSILQGSGLLDVTGGLAAGNFDTNTQLGGSDLTFSTTLGTFPLGATDPLLTYGTGTINGHTIPEPSSLALVGLGLLGLGAFLRRRRDM